MQIYKTIKQDGEGEIVEKKSRFLGKIKKHFAAFAECFFISYFVLLLLLSLSPLPEPTSQELVNSAKRDIEEENYSSALCDLRKIDQTDSLYKEALILISKVDSLLNLQTKNQ